MDNFKSRVAQENTCEFRIEDADREFSKAIGNLAGVGLDPDSR